MLLKFANNEKTINKLELDQKYQRNKWLKRLKSLLHERNN